MAPSPPLSSSSSAFILAAMSSAFSLSASNPLVPPLAVSRSFSWRKGASIVVGAAPPPPPTGITSEFAPRSIRHLCLLSMSSPSSTSMFLSPSPCSLSMTVSVHGRRAPPIPNSTQCIRPKILPVPTPTATPSKRSSTRWSRPRRSAHSLLMIVDCAPLSTKTCSGLPLISTAMYSMRTRPMDSGYSSIIRSYWAWTFDSLIFSPKCLLASASMGSASSRRRISSSRLRSPWRWRKLLVKPLICSARQISAIAATSPLHSASLRPMMGLW
mmetsp:Transcript_2587/g.5967  ORF Transcript_2587/g.5967 Transcript_2587/m.5967 type:complete len:270 (+) Transcript_2587:87-896(+)